MLYMQVAAAVVVFQSVSRLREQAEAAAAAMAQVRLPPALLD
jgi:hypothetical protein